MAKFRKKPVMVDAWCYRDLTLDDAPGWVLTSTIPQEASDGTPTLVVRTLEGDMIASWGDWIIRGVKGEVYPCKPDIFVASYTPVERRRITYLDLAGVVCGLVLGILLAKAALS